MVISRKLTNAGFWLGLAGIWLLALSLRFWGLDRFDTLVFDEVYFAKFANNYLTQTPFFDAHPPLGKYMIALGIKLQGFNPFGFRWMNALTGSIIPLLVAGIAYQLNHRRSYALIAGLLTTADGLLLVESRYALINIYLLFFGLLGQWLLLLALEHSSWQRWLWLILAALSLGATIAVKWNGLGFLLGLFITWLALWILNWLLPISRSLLNSSASLPLAKFRLLPAWKLFLLIPAIAGGLYLQVWRPHMQQNPTPGLWKLQQQMLTYHEGIGSGPNIHPYCSPWYSWPWMIRPVDYFFQRATDLSEPVPIAGPPLPAEAARVIYDVHAMGNPALWWFSTLAVVGVAVMLIQHLWQWMSNKKIASAPGQVQDATAFLVPLYLMSNYAASFLPWVSVSRCTFLYHYMPAAVFSWLALAWLLDRWLYSYQKLLRVLALTLILVIFMALVFWLPIYLGLPLSPAGFQARMWFRSWI